MAEVILGEIKANKGCGPKESQLYLLLSFVTTKIKLRTASDWPIKVPALDDAKEAKLAK